VASSLEYPPEMAANAATPERMGLADDVTSSRWEASSEVTPKTRSIDEETR
jgi:hypothetical protein